MTDIKLFEAIGEIDDTLIERSEKLTDSKKGIWMRYTAVAACFCVVALTFAAFPYLIKKPVVPTVPIPSDTQQTQQLASDTDVTTTVVDDTTKPINEEPDYDPYAIGGNGECPLHEIQSYHGVDGILIEYVGEDACNAWFREKDLLYVPGECFPMNIYDFVVEFDIPNSVLYEFYHNNYYRYMWDIDALLRRDREAFEAYARRYSENPKEWKKEQEQRKNESEFKEKLISYIKKNTNADQREYFFKTYQPRKDRSANVEDICIAELVYDFEIEREVLEELYEENLKENKGSHYKYNFDMIYEHDATLVTAIEAGVLWGYEIDMLLHKQA